MPKVPTTSKKARKVLTNESLIPSSVQALADSRRRSSRLATLNSQAEEARVETPAEGDALRAKPGKQLKTPKARAKAKKEEPADGGEAHEGEEDQQPDKKAAEGFASAARASTGKKGKKQPAERPKKRRKTAKSQASEEEEGKGQADLRPDPVPNPPKKLRRGPTGFALRGENVDDSASARRARLKAALKEGSDEPGQVPKVLENDISRMCAELGRESLGLTAPWQREEGAIGGCKWWVGCHVSASGGVEKAVVNAAATGCRAFALDTRSKLRWESPPLTDETVAAFKKACQDFGFGPEQILPHGSYLINLASPDPDMARKGYGGFLDELQRCERLGLTMYNFHPGSTTGLCSHEESMDRIAGFINDALAATKGVTVVLENMSSVGNIVGGRLWHLKHIIDRVDDKSRIGYCIDTCHLFSSGKDLQTVEACEATFKEIDDVVGLKYLRGMHINDSKTPFDSHRDRHENIGRGSIPLLAFRWIMNNPAFQGIPLIMETPVQEREPPIDFKKSLLAGSVVWKDAHGPYGVGTDRRDVILLNSLTEA